jgi:hypothetical protein
MTSKFAITGLLRNYYGYFGLSYFWCNQLHHLFTFVLTLLSVLSVNDNLESDDVMID